MTLVGELPRHEITSFPCAEELSDLTTTHLHKTAKTGKVNKILYDILLLFAALPFHCLAVQLHNLFKSLSSV